MIRIRINWFELPVGDLERATAFWSVVMSSDLITMDGPDGEMRAFTSDGEPVGALVASGENNPSSNGVRIYLDAAGDLDSVLSRVEPAGGRITVPKTSIGEYGWIIHIIDTEGNMVGLHTV